MSENVLPSGWIRVPLSDVGRWMGGGTPSKSDPRYWTNGTVPWVSPKDMKRSVLHGAEDSITEAAISGLATQVVSPGSVLVVTRSGILKHTLPVAMNAVRVALNQDLKAITPHDGVDGTYLAWALRAFEDRILHECSKAGTTVQSIETSKLQAFELPLAPLAEQRRIVAALEEHLSDLDAALSGLERAKVNTARYRTAAISTAVVGHFDSDSPVPSTVSDLRLPAGWDWVTLRDAAAIKGGITKGQKRRVSEQTREIPYLRVANVQRGYLDLAEIKYIEATESEIEDLRLLPGDVLFNEGGDRDKLGRGWVWAGEIEECIHQNHVFRARLDAARFNPKFVSYFANTWGQRYFLEQGKQTTNLASINLTKLGGLQIPGAPRRVQDEIVERLEQRLAVAGRTAAEIDVQLARASRLRQAILRQAFEGKLVPQDTSDEPASALLTRCRERAQASRVAKRARSRSSARRERN